MQKEVHISPCSIINVTVLCILPHAFHIAIEAALCSLINMFPELVPPVRPSWQGLSPMAYEATAFCRKLTFNEER